MSGYSIGGYSLVIASLSQYPTDASPSGALCCTIVRSIAVPSNPPRIYL